MKICMMGSSFADPVKEIEFAGKHDFQGFELALEYPEATPEQIPRKSKQILDTFSRYNLVRIGHTQSFVNICDFSKIIRRASLKETVKALEAAHRLDISFLTVHPGFLWPVMTREKALKETCKSLEELLKVADLDLILGLEILPPRFFPPRGYVSRTEEFDVVFSQIASQRLKLVLDVAHASFPESDSSLNFIDKFYEKLAHVHLSDNLGQRDDHLPLGAGRVDYETPIKEIKKRGYSGTITLEIFGKDRDYLLMSKRKVEELLR